MPDLHEDSLRGQSKDFLLGYIAGIRTYAVWKSGVQVVGIMQRSFREVEEHCINVWKRVGDSEEG